MHQISSKYVQLMCASAGRAQIQKQRKEDREVERCALYTSVRLRRKHVLGHTGTRAESVRWSARGRCTYKRGKAATAEAAGGEPIGGWGL